MKNLRILKGKLLLERGMLISLMSAVFYMCDRVGCGLEMKRSRLALKGT